MTEQEEWEKRLNDLNDKVNALTTWDDYAEYLQAKYDRLLTEDPRLKD